LEKPYNFLRSWALFAISTSSFTEGVFLVTFCRPIFAPLLFLLVLFTITLPVAARGSEDETAALRKSQDELYRELYRLRDNLVILEGRVLDQQKQLNDLREGQAQLRAGATDRFTSLPPGALPGEAYLQPFGDYAAGRFPQAIVGFEAFIAANPTSEYAGNAQYWLADCYFAQHQYALAVAEFRKVTNNYPAASKAPDALLKSASALQALNLNDQAREALETLRNRYPNSPAAQKTRTQN